MVGLVREQLAGPRDTGPGCPRRATTRTNSATARSATSAYQTYFALPDSGADPELRGLWYAFTAGSVRVISLANDDICYQDGGNSYVRGYSGGRPKALART